MTISKVRVLFVSMIMVGILSTNYAQSNFNRYYDLMFPELLFKDVHVTDTGYFVYGEVISDDQSSGPFFGFFDLDGQEQWHTAILNDDEFFRASANVVYNAKSRRFITAGGFDRNWFVDSVKIIEFDDIGLVTRTKLIPTLGNHAYVTNVAMTTDSGYVILLQEVGAMYDERDFTVLKLDNQWNIDWYQLYHYNLSARPRDLTVHHDGTIKVHANLTNQYEVQQSFIHQDIVLLLEPETGNPIVEYDSGDELYGGEVVSQALDNGDYFVASRAGREVDAGPAGHQILWRSVVKRVDSINGLQWEAEIHQEDFERSDQILDIILTKDNNVVGAGASFDPESPQILSGVIFKANLEGDILWTRRHRIFTSFLTTHHIQSIRETSDGGYVMAGWAENAGGSGFNGWLMKVDSHGCVLPDCHLVATQSHLQVESKIVISPNPASDFIRIECENEGELEVSIFNGRGQVVHRSTPDMQNEYVTIDMRAFPVGTYFAHIFGKNRSSSTIEKIVKY